MIRPAANLSFQFQDRPFLARFEAAAEAGVSGVEYLFPYACDAEDIRGQLQAHGLKQVLFNLPPGDWAAGERGLAARPDRRAAFRESVAQALRYATILGCRTLHCMAGRLDGTPFVDAWEVYLDNLRMLCAQAHDRGITITIKPLNPRDMPDYLLRTPQEAATAIAAVGAPNLKLQLNLYHAQITHGDILTTIARYAQIIGHVQIAGVPHRNDPDLGELNLPVVLHALCDVGYTGWIGCEYTPSDTTRNPFVWFSGTIEDLERRTPA
jgi:hydroxypyruvate isomerase